MEACKERFDVAIACRLVLELGTERHEPLAFHRIERREQGARFVGIARASQKAIELFPV